MSNPNDYTVGWICAITTEYVAAQVFLDATHDPPNSSLSKDDHNDYTLGCIGEHNVVIATLPRGEYGLASAASVAKDMVRSFSNIRIGLMVGIAGGAPSSRHDIRLGDIVVSIPASGKSGVHQYDFGRVIQGHEFQETMALSLPPVLLRTAVGGLESKYEIDGHTIKEAIDDILNKKKRLQKKYKRPDPSSDRLYISDFVHANQDGTGCDGCCDNPAMLQQRDNQTERDNDPMVHYGLIASANQLMMDAKARDMLVEEHDVLCFEMEAAGLMNTFPCVVIRGICDYSDSHKNKVWQGYAAMTAAAYAKDLLSRIRPHQVEAEGRIRELLAIADKVSKIEAGVNGLRSSSQSEEDRKILAWLTTVDYGPQHRDILGRRQTGTGEWFLESPRYREWLASHKQRLLCPGIPGAGKTVIAAIAIDHLVETFKDDKSVGISYIFCNFQKQDTEQKYEDLLASLLKRLAQAQPSLHPSVKELYNVGVYPSPDKIFNALRSVVSGYSRVFIVIDALDECKDGPRDRLLEAVFSLQKDLDTSVSILATSRFNDAVEKYFEGYESLRIHATDLDVGNYVAGRIKRLDSDILEGGNGEIIREEVVKSAEGMFLLAELHMQNLIDQPTRGDVLEAIASLGKQEKALDSAYHQTFKRILSKGGKNAILAKRLLCWVVHAKRRLSSRELQHALAIRLGDMDLKVDFIPSNKVMLSICAGLVRINSEDEVELIHYTTYDFFIRGNIFPDAPYAITRECITYLSFSEFHSGSCVLDIPPAPTGWGIILGEPESRREARRMAEWKAAVNFEKRRHSYCLYTYAACHLGDHAYDVGRPCEEVAYFLTQGALVEEASQYLIVSNDHHWNPSVPVQMSGLHLVAYFGLEKEALSLIESMHVRDRRGFTPLSWAARLGHEAVVRVLLDNGASTTQSSNDFETPLFLALEACGRDGFSGSVKEGHWAVARMLIDKGPDVTHIDHNGHIEPVMDGTVDRSLYLLLHGLPSQSSSPEGLFYIKPEAPIRTLGTLARDGRIDVFNFLLGTNGVDLVLDVKDPYGRTPLSEAAGSGHDDIVKLLLTIPQVDPDAENIGGNTPLSHAALMGHDLIVGNPLEDPQVNPDSMDYQGRTPLSYAAEDGHGSVAERLLADPRVNPDSKSNLLRTPLSYAAENGHGSIVEHLLADPRVNPDSMDDRGRTPLSFAAEDGHGSIVEHLLADPRVNPDSESNLRRTPLSYAAENGHGSIVEHLLADPRVDPNSDSIDSIDPKSTDSGGRTPLSYAAARSHDAIVRLLLAASSIDPDSKDSDGRTPLSYAAAWSYDTIVKLLLATSRVDPNSKDSYGRTPLSYATAEGHDTTVRLLLDTNSIDPDSKDRYGRTPLSYSAAGGYGTTVGLLLATGSVDPYSEDSYGRTPLSYATTRGYDTIVKLLQDDENHATSLARTRRAYFDDEG